MAAASHQLAPVPLVFAVKPSNLEPANQFYFQYEGEIIFSSSTFLSKDSPVDVVDDVGLAPMICVDGCVSFLHDWRNSQ